MRTPYAIVAAVTTAFMLACGGAAAPELPPAPVVAEPPAPPPQPTPPVPVTPPVKKKRAPKAPSVAPPPAERVSADEGLLQLNEGLDGGGTTTDLGGLALTAAPVDGEVDLSADRTEPLVKPSTYTLVVRSVDGEWVDIRVDGKVVLELRNLAEGSSRLTDGTHVVEVCEWGTSTCFAKAQLTTGSAERIVIGVGEDLPVSCYDASDCQPL